MFKQFIKKRNLESTGFIILAVMISLVFISFSACIGETNKSREVVKVEEQKIPPQNDKDQQPLENNLSTVNESSKNECYSLNEVEKDNCYLEKAVTNQNVSYCKAIVSYDIMDMCYSKIALINKQNTQYCFDIKDSSKRQECYYSVATKFNESSFCKRISDLALLRKCMESIKSSCYLLTTDAEINKCLSLEVNNSLLCEGNEDCLLEFSIKFNNILTCDSITSELNNKACLTIVSGSDYCIGFKDLSSRYKCYDIVAKYTNNLQYCNQIDSNTLLYKDCYIRTIINQKRSYLCDNIYAPHNRKVDYVNECYLKYALENKDINSCFNISIRFDRVPCMTKVAYDLNDPSLCNYIESLSEKTRCYGNIIYSNRNLDVNKCALINLTDWKHNCIMTYAFTNKDKDGCSLIDKQNYLDIYNQCIKNAE